MLIESELVAYMLSGLTGIDRQEATIGLVVLLMHKRDDEKARINLTDTLTISERIQECIDIDDWYQEDKRRVEDVLK